MNNEIVKMIFIILGLICVAIGAVGVVLPILPTTPFLILAAFLFAKGSTKFHTWFINTKLYKKHLDSFIKNKSMTLKTKITILLPVTIMLLIAIYIVPIIHAKIFICCLLIYKYYYFIVKIKTKYNELDVYKKNE